MNNIYINEEEPFVINNEYDYSNTVPLVDLVSYLVQYCDGVYKQFLSLVAADEEKNKQFKTEYKNYNYKKSYSTEFEIFIREKSYNNITCKDFISFKSAINDGNLKDIDSLEIRMNLDYGRGKEGNFIEHENSYRIIFNPYEIKFARKSSHNELQMNKIENDINTIFKKFPVVNTIFCTK